MSAHVEIRLESLAEAELDGFLETIRPAYAAERARADHIPLPQAEQFARRQAAEALPRGLQTPGHHFFWIVSASDARVGLVWLRTMQESREAFLYNLTVLPEYRRQGYATAALAAIADFARAQGCGVLGLNVFAPNEAAQRLYRQAGFGVVSMHMNRVLTNDHSE